MGETQKANAEKRVPKRDIKFNITLNEEQKLAKAEILQHAYSFIIGRQGTGKTLLACQIALDLLFKREVEQIIITRPAVGTEDLGFLPGTLEEKMEPWLIPIRSNMLKAYPYEDKLLKHEKDKDIEMISIAHFRGRTFDKAAIIIDEFQNLTKSQLRMAVGRLGKGSIMMLCGDTSQIDIKKPEDSAINLVECVPQSDFTYTVELLENHRHEAVDYIMKFLI